MIAVTQQYIMTKNLFATIAINLSIGFASYLITMSATEDIKNILHLINKSAKYKKKHLLALNQVSGFIQIDGTVKRLSIYALCSS